MTALVEVNNISKSFESFLAVDDINFSLEKGEVLGFLGPNGAGKTTTMRILTGFLKPTSGNIKINGLEFKNGFAVNVGNPHIVFFVDDCFKYDLKKIGPLIENYELFPEKINVTFAQIKDSSNILVNVWERGAGLTKACGTAACATGVVAFEKKLSGNDTNIHFKEGLLNIKYNSVISMTGPVSDINEIQIKL